MPRYKLVLFDFDGTLADSAEGIIHSMRHAFRVHDLDPPEASLLLSHIGKNLRAMIQGMRPDLEDAVVDSLFTAYRERYRAKGVNMSTLYPGVRPMLESMRDAGAVLGVVSNKNHEILKGCVDGTGLKEFFDLVEGSREDGLVKPDPEFYAQRIAPAYPDIEPGQTLYVGDTPTDLDFALNTGMHGCWAAYGYGDRDECLVRAPVYTVVTAPALANLVG